MSEADGAVRRGSCFFEAKRHSGTGVPLDRVERTWVETETNEGRGEDEAGNGMWTRTKSSWQCRWYLSMKGMRVWDLGVCVCGDQESHNIPLCLESLSKYHPYCS